MNIKEWVLGLGLAPVSAGLPPHAQQNEADLKNVAVMRAKAQKGDAQAQLDLGVCYDFGKGVAKDESEAAKWFLLAGEQGDGQAKGAMAKLVDAMTSEQITAAQKLAFAWLDKRKTAPAGAW
jgi:uncharacterized protein